jgi:energy-coupling factor transporter ATP-binding protein EcfA2
MNAPFTHLRIFLSSPGDVADERELAARIVDDLDHSPEFRDSFRLQPLRWDDPLVTLPMPINQTAQKSVDRYLIKPSACDLVVVLFYSRLGTPVNIDGKDYSSGTHYEFGDALHGGVETWIYVRTDEPPFKITDPDFDVKYAEYKRLKGFIDSLNPHGRFDQPYNTYEKPDDFRQLFEQQLTTYLRHLETHRLRPSVSPAPKRSEREFWQGSPFPGLRAFTPVDAPIFFGRGRETDALVKRLSENRFVIVMGASGSGKSSLVGAGLIPRLKSNAIEGSQEWLLPDWSTRHDQWVGLRFTPGEVGSNPFLSLATKLAPLVGDIPRTLAERLADDPAQIETVCEYLLSGTSDRAEALLFVDQFEELFTLVRESQRIAFVELLKRTALVKRLRTVLTMRSDFYHRCLEAPDLARLLEDGQFPLAAPTESLLDMITRPANRAGLVFEDGLTRRILDDTGYEPGALALMAYTLDELYRTALQARREKRISHQDYAELEGVQGAIGKRAETTFARLDREAQDALPAVFRDLVEIDEHGTATRQRALLSRVAADDAARGLVTRLTDARLLTTSQGAVGPVVEVAHEALFHSWERLRTWIATAQDDLVLLRRVKNAAQEWDDHQRDDAYLWAEERLKPVRDMLSRLTVDPQDVVQDFIRPEQARLAQELDDPETTHLRRYAIGERLEVLGDTRPGVGLRADGFPDIVWCPVSGGTITLSSDGQVLNIPDFCIAQYPITNRQFESFLRAADGYQNDVWWTDIDETYRKQPLDEQDLRVGNQPCVRISWPLAVAFCNWLTATMFADADEGAWIIRLPTEHEWMYAATGGDAHHEYPWRDTWDSHRANTMESQLMRITAVGMYPHGAAACGALDMSGNVWEWCLNAYTNPQQVRLSGNAQGVQKGGCCTQDRKRAAVTYRNRDFWFNQDLFAGMRVIACPAEHR